MAILGPIECVAAEFGVGDNEGLIGLWIKMPNPEISICLSNLISAAPDLLEACKAIIIDHDHFVCRLDRTMAEVLRMAIAKAEGRL